MKRLISFVLTFAIILSLGMVAFNVSAAKSGYYTYSYYNGEATITDVDTTISGSITIPSVLDGYTVTSIGKSAFDNCNKITSVVIPQGVEILSERCFYSCDNLTSVTIPNSVKIISNEAFSWCEQLKNVNIPNGVTTIRKHAFYNCDGLTSITIPESVSFISDAIFACCDNLYEINVEKGNNYFTSSDGVLFNKTATILLQYPLAKSNSIYVIPDTVTTIEDSAFYASRKLTSIIISDSVITIGNSAFASCDINSVTIGNNVKTIGSSAFENCKSLKTVTIPSSVEKIASSAFRDCESLTSVTILDGVKIIDGYAFNGCSKLASITLPDSITKIGDQVFSGTACFSNADNWEDNALYIGNYLISCWNFGSVVSGEYTVRPNTVGIADAAFMNNRSITDIYIYDSVKFIGDYAFFLCYNLTMHGYKNSVTEAYAKENNIPFAVIERPKTPGDINSDGAINNKDLGALMQHLNNWAVEITEESSDVNGDGNINNKDYGLLMQYINNWDVELH